MINPTRAQARASADDPPSLAISSSAWCFAGHCAEGRRQTARGRSLHLAWRGRNSAAMSALVQFTATYWGEREGGAKRAMDGN